MAGQNNFAILQVSELVQFPKKAKYQILISALVQLKSLLVVVLTNLELMEVRIITGHCLVEKHMK